jgi:hypothetical protein
VDNVRVIHAIPGRLRLKVVEVKGNPALAGAIEDRLGAVRGIRQVETNPVTGSVLVVYAPEEVGSGESLDQLSEALAPLFPGVDLRQIQSRYASEGNGSSGSYSFSFSLERGVKGLVGSVNSGVGNITGGADLRLLVPLTLFFLGVRSLLVTEKLTFPLWYDFLWFAFATFFAMNPIRTRG